MQNGIGKTPFFELKPFMELKFDRTAFAIKTFEEASNNKAYWLNKTVRERLCASWYLTCQIYGIEYSENVRMDKTVFSMRNHPK